MINTTPRGLFGLVPPTNGVMQDIATPASGAPPAAFVYGEGGKRYTPEELMSLRRRAQALEAAGMDFSPVQHWTQGLARVAQALVGRGLEKDADKASKANAAESNAVLQGLIGGNSNNAAVSAALSNPYIDENVRGLAGKVWDRNNPKPLTPHFWETNDGSLGVVGPDGTPTILYKDPTPKLNWITAENGDGTKQLIPVGPNGPMGQGAGLPTAPVGKLTPIRGGAASQEAGGFR